MSIREKGLNIAASMKRLATTSGLTINEIRVVLAIERIVARFQSSEALAASIIFKGGFALLKTAASKRFTRDLDALILHASRDTALKLIMDALSTDLDDGFWFGDIQVSDLPDHGEYEGLRFTAAYQIGERPTADKIHKLSRIHFDAAFGDVLPIGSYETRLNSFVSDFESLSWRVYPLESIAAEKLETLVRRGSLNSRAKDCYDLVLILDQVPINDNLRIALLGTFGHRQTPLPLSFFAMFSALDLTTLRSAWSAVTLSDDAMSFEQCVERLKLKLDAIDDLLTSSSKA